MRRITITQINFDGQGNDRIAYLWVKADQVALTIERKSRAYNMDHTIIIASDMPARADACMCKPHKIFGHEDGCLYEGMGSMPAPHNA